MNTLDENLYKPVLVDAELTPSFVSRKHERTRESSVFSGIDRVLHHARFHRESEKATDCPSSRRRCSRDN